MELNVQDWKEFPLSKLFEMTRGTRLTTYDRIKGDIPLVTAGEENSGVSEYISNIEQEKFNDTLTIDMFNNCFYHRGIFCADDNILILNNDDISIDCKLFISAVINQDKYRYSYGRQYRQKNFVEHYIRLPILCNNADTPVIDENRRYSDEGYIPDWQFMENYIKSLHHKPITTKVKTGNVKELDVDNWEEFKVQDLFKLVHGKANDGMLEEGNDCVYLGAKLNDCGFMRRCKYNEKLAHEGNCICFVTNGEGSVGYAFYKGLEDKFIATIDLVMGYADFLTPAIGSFIATCLCLERRKYSHGRKWKKTLPTTVIKLPIQRDSNGNPVIDDNRTYSDNGYIPDWQFMEDYINSLPYSDRI